MQVWIFFILFLFSNAFADIALPPLKNVPAKLTKKVEQLRQTRYRDLPPRVAKLGDAALEVYFTSGSPVLDEAQIITLMDMVNANDFLPDLKAMVTSLSKTPAWTDRKIAIEQIISTAEKKNFLSYLDMFNAKNIFAERSSRPGQFKFPIELGFAVSESQSEKDLLLHFAHLKGPGEVVQVPTIADNVLRNAPAFLVHDEEHFDDLVNFYDDASPSLEKLIDIETRQANTAHFLVQKDLVSPGFTYFHELPTRADYQNFVKEILDAPQSTNELQILTHITSDLFSIPKDDETKIKQLVYRISKDLLKTDDFRVQQATLNALEKFHIEDSEFISFLLRYAEKSDDPDVKVLVFKSLVGSNIESTTGFKWTKNTDLPRFFKLADWMIEPKTFSILSSEEKLLRMKAISNFLNISENHSSYLKHRLKIIKALSNIENPAAYVSLIGSISIPDRASKLAKIDATHYLFAFDAEDLKNLVELDKFLSEKPNVSMGIQVAIQQSIDLVSSNSLNRFLLNPETANDAAAIVVKRGIDSLQTYIAIQNYLENNKKAPKKIKEQLNALLKKSAFKNEFKQLPAQAIKSCIKSIVNRKIATH